jgi:NADPH-dependent ferric siderophore reductase
VLAGASLETFACEPGQDVMLVLGQVGERALSRRYTIRSFDPRTRLLELNIVAHGVAGPGARWAAAVQPGDRVNGVGPRGKIFLNREADWHLFLGDETAGPVSLNMLEGLAADVPAQAFIEVVGPEDELAGGGGHAVHWLHRGARPAVSSTLLVDTLSSLELPPGRWQVYLNGEVELVLGLQRLAWSRGLPPEQVSAKAYWGRGKANAGNGEPEKRAA